MSRGSYGLYVRLLFGLRSGLEFRSSEPLAEACIERVSLGWLVSKCPSLICLAWYRAHLRPGVRGFGLIDPSLSYPDIFEAETVDG